MWSSATVSVPRIRLPLLDLNLPGLEGIEVCKQIREFSTVLIAMSTARVDAIDRLLGLELGADDYICKPFSPREVVARVTALLRRAALGLKLDTERLQARIDGVSLALTTVEFRLLEVLYQARAASQHACTFHALLLTSINTSVAFARQVSPWFSIGHGRIIYFETS